MNMKTTAYASLAALALTVSTTAFAQDTINTTTADPTLTTAPLDDDRDEDDDSGKWGLLGLLGLAGLLGLKRRDHDHEHVRTDRAGTGTTRP